MPRRRPATPDRRRQIVEFRENLDDQSEIYEEERSALLDAGDAVGARERMEEFGRWRQNYLAQGEANGLYEGGVFIGSNQWLDWGWIAFRAEREAVRAGADFMSTDLDPDGESMVRSYRESMTAVMAAAFMIESLYGSVCYLVPDAGGDVRWSKILRTLQMLFDVSSIRRLDQHVEELFSLRDDAAHPWVAIKATKPHSAGFTNVAQEVATYTPEVATKSINLACNLIDRCSRLPHPGNRRAARWARRNRPGFEQLVELRAAPSGS